MKGGHEGTHQTTVWEHWTRPTHSCLSSADLQVVLSVQHPGGEFLLRGARYAPQTVGVKGQAHDGLRVGFGLAQLGPLGYVPQQQGAVLISSQQERSGARVWLEEREGDKRKEEAQRDGKREHKEECEVRCEVGAVS